MGLALSIVAIPRPAAADTPTTIVSLTFDDTLGDQYDQVRDLLHSRAMHATFYVNSGRIGGSDYMTLDQLRTLEADGNEIGGHTVHHVPLANLTLAEQRRQICDDRANLLSLGFHVTDFAYPLSSFSDDTKQIAADCGYVSGRAVGGIACDGCSAAESIPPADAMRLRSPSSIVPSTTIEDLEGYVTTAEDAGGGWVPLVFHHACDGCNPLSITPERLASFLDWLGARADRGTVMRTVQEVLGGDVRPPVRAPDPPRLPEGAQLLPNASFEQLDTSSDTPGFVCWTPSLGEKDAFQIVPEARAHTGAVALSMQVTQLTDSGVRVVVTKDMGQCAPLASEGHAYHASLWYRGETAPRLVAYWRDELGMWRYFHSSKAFSASSTWARADWTTNPLPQGATAISVGFEVTEVGSITVDDASLVDMGESGSGGHGGCTAARGRSAANAAEAGVLVALVWLAAARRRRITSRARPVSRHSAKERALSSTVSRSAT
jgi:hypothetical protein